MPRALAPLAALLLLSGCPEEIGLQCPPQASSLGQFTLNFAGQRSGEECVATSADGGDAGIGPLTLDDAGQGAATLCFASASDGGGQLTLVTQGKTARTSPLADGGTFAFQGSTEVTNGTNCICPVGIAETFTGKLVGASPDAGLTPQDDGGLPPVLSLNGTLTDTLTAGTAGDPTCICKTPCTVTYLVTGTRF
jgi:hypothetical protein